MVFLYALLAEHETKFSFAAVLSIETMIFGLNGNKSDFHLSFSRNYVFH